jgi:tRNA-dihydrouridine synthase
MCLYRPITIGSLKLDGNLFLAPVAGYSDRGFRSLCVEQGAHFSFTELVSAEALYRNPGHYGLGGEPA